MIRLNCTNCNATLMIDEAFAGGVCRCQHCGTIQTVPPLGVTQAASPQKLYERKARAEGSGLDALADALSSSGLSGSGLAGRTQSSQRRKNYTLPPKNNNLMVTLLIGAGVVIVALILFIIYKPTNSTPEQPPDVQNPPPAQPMTRLPDHASPTPAHNDVHPDNVPPPVVAKREQQFLGQPIHEKSVVYLLDSSIAMQNSFDPMLQACFRSLESLKPSQHFQVIFWHNQRDFSYPQKGLISASPEHVKIAEDHLQSAYPMGASDIEPALKRALESHPEAICLVSGKWLNPEFANVVLTEVGESSVKIYCFSLSQPDSSGPMLKISNQTHGDYHDISSEDLSMYGQ